MNIQHYAISAICNYDECAIYALTKFKADYFTEKNVALFKIATGLYKMNKAVDLGVFVSQAGGVGLDSNTATMIYHYCLDYSDDWLNNFEELKRQGTYRIIANHQEELDQMRSIGEPIEKISGKAVKFASEWISGYKKTYYSGKEIDELTEEIGLPIKTGYDLYDNQIYKFGGNQTGQMKGIILRQKHGKTRSECWESAQNLRMGHKILYFALEATKKEIAGNFKQVLMEDWEKYRDNLFIVDGVRDLSELEAIVTEAVLVEGVEKVVVDYIQLVQVERIYSENERINEAVEKFRELMIRHNFHCVIMSQARKEDVNAQVPKDADGNQMMHKGYRFVPNVYDAYGSSALVNASSMILIGFRPNRYEELTKVSPLGNKVVSPKDTLEPINTVFFKVALSRYKNDYVHKWYKFVDGDNGLMMQGWL